MSKQDETKEEIHAQVKEQRQRGEQEKIKVVCGFLAEAGYLKCTPFTLPSLAMAYSAAAYRDPSLWPKGQ